MFRKNISMKADRDMHPLFFMCLAVVVMMTGFLGTSCVAREGEKNMGTSDEMVTVFNARTGGEETVQRVSKTDAEWKKTLSPEAYKITRKKGTERSFAGEYNDNKEEGLYACIGCGTHLFASKDKFDSGTGWPSFVSPVDERNIKRDKDNRLFMVRTEVLCPRCGAHLGHVFDDGPAPTNKRFCINSAALDFIKAD